MADATPAYTPINGAPVKSFFVRMLTRDIDLEDAILDLLDNCVDGVLRTTADNGHPLPYEGKSASIDIQDDSFSISDNCGGIPWSLREYAFRMGRSDDRPQDSPGAVGVYGIGMKRAIFKMGQDCQIHTQNTDHSYRVHISKTWLEDDQDWSIPVQPAAADRQEDGTTIVVRNLYPGIERRFATESHAFCAALADRVATHYAHILAKGFRVTINGADVTPSPTRLLFGDLDADAKTTIRPYIFTTEMEGVQVFLAVGFTQPLPTLEEATSEDAEKLYSSEHAGWTVLCNDRAVLFCDKTALTGWGEAGVPRYHTQFIAIAGIVEFRSDDARRLPTTTTKRGVDASSSLYLSIKNRMREGMGHFTDFTYKWKGRETEARKHILAGRSLGLDELKAEASTLSLKTVRRTFPEGRQYKPRLPKPRRVAPNRRRIAYYKDVGDVKAVARHLLNDESASASAVGEECFDIILSDAKS